MSYETASDYPEGMPRIPQIKAVGPEMADDPAAALRAAPPAGTRSPAGAGHDDAARNTRQPWLPREPLNVTAPPHDSCRSTKP